MSPLVIGEFIGAYEIVDTLGAGGMGDLAQVKEAYRADHLVATTITKKAKRLVLNVQLVDTRTWKVRWGHQYEGAQADYNDLVRDAAEAVARTLAQEA
ncbi:MAG TPA: hypothetical protein VGJ89_06620 [Geothrix sp.]